MSDAAIASALWPGLARPPTTCGADRGKVMNGRHEAGHDTVGTTPPLAHNFNAYPGSSGPSIQARVPRQMARTSRAMTMWEHPGPSVKRLILRLFPRYVHLVGLVPAIHDFAAISTAGRGWPGQACPRAGRRPGPRARPKGPAKT